MQTKATGFLLQQGQIGIEDKKMPVFPVKLGCLTLDLSAYIGRHWLVNRTNLIIQRADSRPAKKEI